MDTVELKVEGMEAGVPQMKTAVERAGYKAP